MSLIGILWLSWTAVRDQEVAQTRGRAGEEHAKEDGDETNGELETDGHAGDERDNEDDDETKGELENRQVMDWIHEANIVLKSNGPQTRWKIDPATGFAESRESIVRRYEGEYTSEEIEKYWIEACYKSHGKDIQEAMISRALHGDPSAREQDDGPRTLGGGKMIGQLSGGFGAARIEDVVRITVVTPEGERVVVVPRGSTIGEVKVCMHVKEGIPADQQRMFCQEQELKTDEPCRIMTLLVTQGN